MLNQAQLKQLFAPINPVRVQQRQGKFSYLETWDVIAHLGRLFGPENWDHEVDAEIVFEENRGDGKWDVCYRAKAKLIIRDPDGGYVCFKEGVATGSAHNQPHRADAHDLALKSAASDALKRAAIGLGNQFGLSLYDGGSTKSVLGRTLAHPALEGEE